MSAPSGAGQVLLWVRKYVGAYAAAMNGWISSPSPRRGENSPAIRAAVAGGLGFLGVKLDAEKNKCRGRELEISTPGQPGARFRHPHQRGADDRPRYPGPSAITP
jgi:acetate kinase